MQRRVFLGQVASVGAAAAVPMAAGAGERPAGRLKVLDSYVTNRERFPQAVWPRPGTVLGLRRDPRRAFDARSVQVVDPTGAPLGYLPPASTQVLAALMDHGTPAEAVVGEAGKLSVFIGTA